jgi:hypothetical protein
MIKTGVIIMALFGFLNAGWFSHLFDSTPTPPITVPIDLSKAGSIVELKVRIKEKGTYYFTLEFLYANPKKFGWLDMDKAEKIVGLNGYNPSDGKQLSYCDYEYAKRTLGNLIDKNYDCDGTVIPIMLSVYKLNKDQSKKLILDKTYMTKGMGIGSGPSRDFEALRLDKGKYSIRVENIKAILEMKNRKADFRFGRYGHK